MESIDKFFKGERDYLFIKGREQGRKEGLKKALEQCQARKDNEKNLSFTKSLILQTSFNNKEIAGLVGVSEDFVKEARENLKE
jgi:hypothetical protein